MDEHEKDGVLVFAFWDRVAVRMDGKNGMGIISALSSIMLI